MSSQQMQFLLPDLLFLCPLKGGTNPHYGEVGPESATWINNYYHVFTDRKRAYLSKCSAELLASFVYPYVGYEQFRTCCDYVCRRVAAFLLLSALLLINNRR